MIILFYQLNYLLVNRKHILYYLLRIRHNPLRFANFIMALFIDS